MSHEGTTMSEQPVDHGWAWAVSLGSFISFFFLQGTVKSLGILLVQFINLYKAEQGTTALVVGLVIGIWSLLTPLVMALTKRLTFRQIMIAGSLLTSSAAVTTAWAPNIYVCIVVFGGLTGTGYACLLVPTLSMVSAYFEKHISLANGIAGAGGSVGQLLFPVFLTYLLKMYSIQGVLVIYGGCFLHLLIAAALMRPPTFYTKYKYKTRNGPSEESRDLNGMNPGLGHNRDPEATPDQSETMLQHFDTTGDQVGKDTESSSRKSKLADDTIPKQQQSGRSVARELLCDPIFVLYVIGVSLGTVAYFGIYHFMPVFCQDLGVDPDDVAFILMLSGVVHLVVHLPAGWIADRVRVQRANIVGLNACLQGIVTILCGTLFPSYLAMLTLGIVIGVTGGIINTVYAVLLRDIVGADKFPTAMGLVILFRGVVCTPSPVIFGKLRDVTGSYKVTFCVCGILSICLFVMISCGVPCAQRWKDHQEATAKLNVQQAGDETVTKV